MKTETIKFSDFMSREKEAKVKKVNWKKLSATASSFIISPTSWLNPPQVVVNGYIVVLVIGGILITAAIFENTSFSSGSGELGEFISLIFGYLLPFSFIGGLVYFVLSNPLL